MFQTIKDIQKCQRKDCEGKKFTGSDYINNKCLSCHNYILKICCCHYENCEDCYLDQDTE